MLRLTLDIVPFGIEEEKRNIHTIEIWNVGPTGVDYLQDGEPRYSYAVRTIDEHGNKKRYGTLVKWFDRRQPAHMLVNEVYQKLQEKGAFETYKKEHVKFMEKLYENLEPLDPEFSKIVDEHFWELIGKKEDESDV